MKCNNMHNVCTKKPVHIPPWSLEHTTIDMIIIKPLWRPSVSFSNNWGRAIIGIYNTVLSNLVIFNIVNNIIIFIRADLTKWFSLFANVRLMLVNQIAYTYFNTIINIIAVSSLMFYTYLHLLASHQLYICWYHLSQASCWVCCTTTLCPQEICLFLLPSSLSFYDSSLLFSYQNACMHNRIPMTHPSSQESIWFYCSWNTVHRHIPILGVDNLLRNILRKWFIAWSAVSLLRAVQIANLLNPQSTTVRYCLPPTYVTSVRKVSPHNRNSCPNEPSFLEFAGALKVPPKLRKPKGLKRLQKSKT